MSWGCNDPVVGREGATATGPGAAPDGAPAGAPGVAPGAEPEGAPPAPGAGRGGAAVAAPAACAAPRSWRFITSSLLLSSSTRPDRLVTVSLRLSIWRLSVVTFRSCSL